MGSDRRDWISLVGVTAHELRHPLHLMRLALHRHLPSPQDPGRQSLDRYIDRMTRIVGDLADLVRIDQDALVIQRSSIDVTQLLREAVDSYRADAAARGLELTIDGMLGPHWIQADGHRLLQVFSNVLDNALKFTPEGGCISLLVLPVGERLEIHVRDNGHGIAIDALPYVFDLFASSAAPRGTGIGLTVARRIVELHNGNIAVLSDGPEHGTDVVITLPLAADPSQTLTGAAAASPAEV